MEINIVLALCIFMFGMGGFIGIISEKVHVKRTISHILEQNVSGTLKIDTSDPEEAPYLFLEVSESVDQLMQRTHVVLKVDNSSYLSQK